MWMASYHRDYNNANVLSTLHVFILGKAGVGKSASGNTILGRKAFRSKKSAKAVTQACTTETVTVDELNIVIHDTPGFLNPDVSDEAIELIIKQDILNISPGASAFLLVVKIDRFTAEEKKVVGRVERLLGEKRLKQTWIVFTRGDELELNQTIENYISESKDLKTFLGNYETRYHVFNNKSDDRKQVKSLLEKVCSSVLQRSSYNHPERRLILLGKSGAGKSATGNTILNGEYFKSEMCMSAVTQTTQVERAAVNGKDVCVVDTPGLFDTNLSVDALTLEFARSVYECAPGPHAFLIVMPVNNRFTEQDKHMIDTYQALFGPRLGKHAIILFTHGDLLEGTTVEQLVKQSRNLTKLIEQCGGRYQLFNNKDASNTVQVKQLMDKIENMIESRGGSCYTSEMFEAAKEAQREAEERQRQEAEERERREEKPQSVKMSEEVLRERKVLEAKIRNMTDKVSFLKQKQQELRLYEQAVQKCQEDLNDTTCEVEIEVIKKVKKDADHWVTSCNICEENCHTECWWVRDLSGCSVMKDGKCTVCTGGCHHTKHKQENKKYFLEKEKIREVDLKKKLELKGIFGTKTKIVGQIKEKLVMTEKHIDKLLEASYNCVVQLDRIALK